MNEFNTPTMFRLVTIAILIVCFGALLYSIHMQAPIIMSYIYLALTIINSFIVAYVMLPQKQSGEKSP